MHPAPSIIAFTVLSGLGFGLMIWLGLGAVDVEGWIAGTFCFLALAFASAGLLSSLFHLGHPERAVKALSQWRSSWLSREGVFAVLTLGCFVLYAFFWAVLGIRVGFIGFLSAVLALLTVFCTAMIYAQMKTVPRWNSNLTPVIFLLSSLTGGALLAGVGMSPLFLAVLGAVVVFDWIRGDESFAKSGSTLTSATGNLKMGLPRLLAPPHTGHNYLLHEMVFVIARKHVQKLRIIGFIVAIGLPFLAVAFLTGGHLEFGIAILCHIAGMLLIRWTFFAQAEHVVGLYYGKR